MFFKISLKNRHHLLKYFKSELFVDFLLIYSICEIISLMVFKYNIMLDQLRTIYIIMNYFKVSVFIF